MPSAQKLFSEPIFLYVTFFGKTYTNDISLNG